MANRLKVPVGPRDHRLGPDTAPVTLVEYGDFECPQCAQAHPIVKRVKETFGDGLRLVFRHFPLTNSHPHAQHAAEAAEWAVAHRTDVFWEIHDALFAASKSLSDDKIISLTKQLNLPGDELPESWASRIFLKRVKEDFLSGIDSGVTGTPGFFINGERLQGGWDEVGLVRAIEAAATRASESALRPFD
jgi:protein-disulfide isomerase